MTKEKISQQGELAYIVGKGWQVDEMYPVGTKLYTAPPNYEALQKQLDAAVDALDYLVMDLELRANYFG